MPDSGLQLSMYQPRGSEGSEKRYIEGWEMHSWGERTEKAAVRAYVVSFPGEEVFKFANSGIGAAFKSDAKEPQAGVIVW